MARLPLVPEPQVPQDLKVAYHGVSKPESGLAATYQALFASPATASQLANLDELLRDQVGLEPCRHSRRLGGGSNSTRLLGDLYQTKTNCVHLAHVGMLGDLGVSCGGCEGTLRGSG